jgi:hypothetical protein
MQIGEASAVSRQALRRLSFHAPPLPKGRPSPAGPAARLRLRSSTPAADFLALTKPPVRSHMAGDESGFNRMLPVRRHVFTFFSALLLLLCAAACALWVRSNRVADVVTHAGMGRVRIVSCDGGVFVEVFKLTGRYGDPSPGQPDGAPLAKYAESTIDYREWAQEHRGAEAGVPWRWDAVPPEPDVLFRGWGAEHGWLPALIDGLAGRVWWKSNHYYYSLEENWLGGWRVWMPYWSNALVAGIPPAVWLRPALRRRRLARGVGLCKTRAANAGSADLPRSCRSTAPSPPGSPRSSSSASRSPGQP